MSLHSLLPRLFVRVVSVPVAHRLVHRPLILTRKHSEWLRPSQIHDLIDGNERFRRIQFEDVEQSLLESIEKGQKPSALFIGCCDSRVLPSVMLQVKPGDLFVTRTIGGFIPPYRSNEAYKGQHAVIQYAVSILGVSDVIVCTHSHCGACKALLEGGLDDVDPNLKHLRDWLQLGQAAKELTLRNIRPDAAPEISSRIMEQFAAVTQVEHLMTHPCVARRVEEKTLNVHAWHYEIDTGDISYYDTKLKRFRQLRRIKQADASR